MTHLGRHTPLSRLPRVNYQFPYLPQPIKIAAVAPRAEQECRARAGDDPFKRSRLAQPNDGAVDRHAEQSAHGHVDGSHLLENEVGAAECAPHQATVDHMRTHDIPEIHR